MKIDKILDFFVNPKDKENPENLRKGRFFVASLLILIILGIPVNIYFFFFKILVPKDKLIILGMSLLTVALLLLYKKTDKRILFVNIITAFIFVLHYLIYYSGGIYSLFNLRPLVFSGWVFLVAGKRSGLFWFGITLVYLIFFFYAEQIGLRDFKTDIFQSNGAITFVNTIFFSTFLAIIIYLYETGKEKYLNALLEAKKNIELKNTELEIQKKDIISSINYARRIQVAVFPGQEIINKCIPNSFILNLPKNIVSGDFFYLKQIDNKIFLAAADCTGHGVPASLMTILGITILNEIITVHNITESNFILDELRNRIKESMNQTGKIHEAKDGMDIALCIIKSDNKLMQFSGANNGLIKINSGIITEFKADKNPISIYPIEKPYQKAEIQIDENDVFYIFSDGFMDQFGGENSKKFSYKQFTKLLADIQPETLTKQKEILEQSFYNWKNSNEQTDDVLIIGFKYN